MIGCGQWDLVDLEAAVRRADPRFADGLRDGRPGNRKPEGATRAAARTRLAAPSRTVASSRSCVSGATWVDPTPAGYPGSRLVDNGFHLAG
jgi:hypothetical protein